jgi:hypothetical protein
MTAITLNLPDAIAKKLNAMPDRDEFATEVFSEKIATPTKPNDGSLGKPPLPDANHKKGDILDFVNARIAEQKADPEGTAKRAKEMHEELKASRDSWSEAA